MKEPTIAPRSSCAGNAVDSSVQAQAESSVLIAEVWRSVQPTDGEIRAARRRLQINSVLIAGLLGSAYWFLVISDQAVLVRLGAAGVLVVALVALATSVMHDANHGSFSTHRWVNRALGYTADALGTSSWLWRTQHNTLHHGNTNVVGFDADLELSPWARVAPSQPWRRRFRFQHIYIWPLYGFLAIKNLLVSDLLSLRNGTIGHQRLREPVRPRIVVQVVLGKLVHLGWALVVPLLFNPWWGVLAFYAACSWLVGFMLAVIFQLAHCVDLAEMPDRAAPRRGADFAAHQLRTTVDIDAPMPVFGHFFRWISGGLDHQIEHHLSPRLPHTIYPALAVRFRDACAREGIAYRCHSGVWAGLRSHSRWLRAMGRVDGPGVAA